VCTVSANAVRVKDSGTCTIKATVAESRNYLEAVAVTRSFVITAVAPFAPTLDTISGGDATITVDSRQQWRSLHY
jgi:hypothetical protein